MCRAREDIATTSFVGEREIEKGFEGSGMAAGVMGEEEGCLWMWRVESQEAEMTRQCSLLYTTDLTPAPCELRTVWEDVRTSILRSISRDSLPTDFSSSRELTFLHPNPARM
jgi:hypothetical protein